MLLLLAWRWFSGLHWRWFSRSSRYKPTRTRMYGALDLASTSDSDIEHLWITEIVEDPDEQGR